MRDVDRARHPCGGRSITSPSLRGGELDEGKLIVGPSERTSCLAMQRVTEARANSRCVQGSVIGGAGSYLNPDGMAFLEVGMAKRDRKADEVPVFIRQDRTLSGKDRSGRHRPAGYKYSITAFDLSSYMRRATASFRLASWAIWIMRDSISSNDGGSSSGYRCLRYSA